MLRTFAYGLAAFAFGTAWALILEGGETVHSNTAELLMRANVPIPDFVKAQTFDVWMLWACGIAGLVALCLFLASFFTQKSVIIQPLSVKVFPHKQRVLSDPFFLNAAKEPNNVLFGLKLKVINQSEKPVCLRHWSFYIKPNFFEKVRLAQKVYGHNSGPVFGFPATKEQFIGKKTEPCIGPNGSVEGTVALEIPPNVRKAGVAEAVNKNGATFRLIAECKQAGKKTVRRSIKITNNANK